MEVISLEQRALNRRTEESCQKGSEEDVEKEAPHNTRMHVSRSGFAH
jgi:hypothetical protein